MSRERFLFLGYVPLFRSRQICTCFYLFVSPQIRFRGRKQRAAASANNRAGDHRREASHIRRGLQMFEHARQRRERVAIRLLDDNRHRQVSDDAATRNKHKTQDETINRIFWRVRCFGFILTNSLFPRYTSPIYSRSLPDPCRRAAVRRPPPRIIIFQVATQS